jgi:hypothetical protein
MSSATYAPVIADSGRPRKGGRVLLALSPWKHRVEVKVEASDIPKTVDDGLAGLKKLRAPRREIDAYVAEMGVEPALR